MARWGKSYVVPLDSLIKEKENTNRPVPARSAGTVGKWGKMGFTSTRTYAFKAFTTVTPPEPVDVSEIQATQANEPPKPKKFFKSRNSTAEAMRTQIIHHLPRAPPSPVREISLKKESPLKIKIPKPTVERKKSTSSDKGLKSKKKKEEKKLKPEAPPSRVISRQRKVVNYNEEDDDDYKIQTSVRNAVTVPSLPDNISRSLPKQQDLNIEMNMHLRTEMEYDGEEADTEEEVEHEFEEEDSKPVMEPPPVAAKSNAIEHPPIVLRISKGTSRLISTDSEEVINSPIQHSPVIEQTTGIASTEELLSVLSGDPIPVESEEIEEQAKKIAEPEIENTDLDTSLSVAEPTKHESLKIVIKTDALKNAFISEKPEKKNKNKKHKKTGERQPKTPSPKTSIENRLMSPPPSEKDFDSQSSILGSISSKGTNNFPAVAPEDSCVIRSRGSSDVTSDLETSQHSSLVAPPSDIESRLESMMDCDDTFPLEGVDSTACRGYENKLMTIKEEPLKEDILKVLTGETEDSEKQSDIIEKQMTPSHETSTIVSSPPDEESGSRRVTRSRKGVNNTQYTSETVSNDSVSKTGRVTRNNNNGNLRSNSGVLPPTRSYTRKRKNVPVQILPEIVERKSETSEIDLPDAPTVSNIESSENNTTEITNKSDTVEESTEPEIEEREYKIKNKFKRTWYERDAKKVDGSELEGQPNTKKIYCSSTENNMNSSSRLRSSKIINNNNTENGDRDSSSGMEDEKRSVKLVISKKKGSIFKSRALVPDQGDNSKKRHVYKHTWDDENEEEKPAGAASVPSDNENVFDDFTEESITKFSRLTKQNVGKFEDENVTTVKCDRKAKEYYTVVRNVKTAHQIQEIGEYQEMKDDVDYILDALQPHNPIPTRCLSALQLATKCMTPAFRMHVRAHGTVAKFFKALRDAKNNLSLGLCTATIMFVLSQDALNIDLDRDSLGLMMNLLEANLNPSDEENGTFERNKQKVREICEEIKSQGKAAHLNIDSISVGTLAMETLLSLTSKKAGEWFKEELRELGGLEHIIKTICECCHQISDYVVSWTEILLDKLKTIERCLRVLENVSEQNERNQDYILSYSSGHAVDTLFKLYKLCDSEIALYPTTDSTPKDNPGVVLREALVPTLKVLINLTHPFDQSAVGSAILGQRAGIFDTSFHILLQAPNYVPERCIFELGVLVLLLLINLTMHTTPNRTLIMKSHAPSDFGNQFDKVPAIKALIEFFYRCQEQALLAEQNTDEILENPDSRKKKPQSQEEMDETVTKLLQKAGHHMEHTLQASYAGILIGHLISDSPENEAVIRSYLRENKFQDIITVLEKYYNFMNLTASSEATVVSHIKSTKKIIDHFKKCDAHSSNETDNGDSQEQLETVTTPSNSSISTRSTSRCYKSYSQR